MDGAMLAKGDHFFQPRKRAGFGFRQSGGDPFVFDQTANQIGQHRIPVFPGGGPTWLFA